MQLTLLASLMDGRGGIQNSLNELAKLPQFKAIMESEVNQWNLVMGDVEACRSRIYHELSKHAHGNSGIITIRGKDMIPAECTAVICYLNLHETWPGPHLEWNEEVQ